MIYRFQRDMRKYIAALLADSSLNSEYFYSFISILEVFKEKIKPFLAAK